jgi:hypothetical protein
MVCVIAEQLSWRLATITQNITLNKIAMCTQVCSKCKLISTVSKLGIMLHVLRRNISPFGELFNYNTIGISWVTILLLLIHKAQMLCLQTKPITILFLCVNHIT